MEAIKPAPVLNLSSSVLTNSEIDLLTKGLNFVPKPSKIDKEEIDKSIDQFKRRLKLVEFMKQYEKKEQKPFYDKSDFDPPDELIKKLVFRDSIPEIIENLRTEIHKLDFTHKNSNMTKLEKQALKSLKTNKNIIIKPADKGSCTVIMDKIDYINEGVRQLSNSNHYKKIEEPVYPNISPKINQILDDLYHNGFLDKKQIQYLKPPEAPRERRLYLLPKIHKDQINWHNNMTTPPGRPIVSDCSSDTYRIAEYIDYYLAPLATSHPSYIRDTPDFIDKLSKVNTARDSFLITIDVDSLYTNIDNKDGISAINQQFILNPDEKRPDKEILELLKLSLENNDFMFNEEWYLQIWGTAMGKKFAPNYANIFLANWEKEALKKCSKLPDCYFRYLDDIFIIWSHTKEEFWQFFNTLNSHHPTIKLKASISEISIDFLDVTIFKGQRFTKYQRLDTKVFFKPTDTHQLLHKSSYHPKHTFRSLIKSQIIRFHRICNNESDFDNACTILFSALKFRGYSKRFLRTIKSQTLLDMKPSAKSEKCHIENCPTCPHLLETSSILTNKKKTVFLRENLNCRTEGVIYAIKCTNCEILYVGQSSGSLHRRLTQHRSDINTKKDTQIAKHFSNECPNINYLKIVPLEHVQRQILDTFMNLFALEDLTNLLRREQIWMQKLNTLIPNGLNKRTDIPPPIPFIMKYNDQSGKINKLFKETYHQKQSFEWYYSLSKYQFVAAQKRNKNLKDHLVSSTIRNS